ncbi:MAG: hypothetical protein ACK53T_07925 [Planctomycetota bacterium]|jgi:hypothetical protein
MAKKPEHSFFKKVRAERIANCGDCGGNPPTDKFNLQGMFGLYCTKCMEVVNWRPTQDTTPKIPVVVSIDETGKDHYDPMNSRVVTLELRENVPVDKKIKFEELKIE